MRRFVYYLLLVLCVLSISTSYAQKKVIKTMMISGQDGSHYWQGACEAMKQILENSGMFKVDFAFTPNFGGDINTFKPNFAKYDLVVINYGGEVWSQPVRKAFEKYVTDGGGVVIIHSSVVPMADWKGYNEIIGMGAWDGRSEKDGPFLYWKDGKYVYDYTPGYAGYHGLQHETLIEHRALQHPILKGLPVRWKHFKDEIYTRLRGPVKNMEILATAYERGRHEPLMWTVRPGKGRVFVDLLGHCGNDPDMVYSMECTGFQVTLLRGAEWAATGKVNQDVPLDFPLEDTYTLRPDFKAPFHAKNRSETKKEPVVLAYVTSWSNVVPDPKVVTHINYAFGHVAQSFDGVRISNEDRLRSLVTLKQEKPDLKILLSIGGWGSGNFSEMAASSEYRKAFAKDCKRVVDTFHLDGIDIDWEYPTSDLAGISSSADDTRNFTFLIQDIRDAIGRDKLLTLASVASGQYIDFAEIEPFVDFVNIMTYDVGMPPRHHAALFRSDMAGSVTCEEAIANHVKAGMPIDRLVLGIPFYGHGINEVPSFCDYKKIIELKGYKRKWDDVAKVPYLIDAAGNMVCCYEDSTSIRLKCAYARELGMLGAMYWDYDGDDTAGTLREAVYNGMNF